MFERVLVGTDRSDTATRAVEAAAVIARAHRSDLIIGHAFRPHPSWRQQDAWAEAPEEVRWQLTVGAVAEALVQAAVEHARQMLDDEARIVGRCEPGRPVGVLLAMIAAFEVDALVIGNRDMRARLGLGGSVGRALTRRAPCDVIVIDTVGRREVRPAAGRRATLGWA